MNEDETASLTSLGPPLEDENPVIVIRLHWSDITHFEVTKSF